MTYVGSIDSRRTVLNPDGFPTKLYVFGMALKDRLTSKSVFRNRPEILQYLLEILDKNKEIATHPHLYAIAAAWGYTEGDGGSEKPVKAMDIFSYRFDGPWNSCNPDVDNWVFKNGIFTPADRTVTCETTTIILGEEAKLRRKTKDLEKYIGSWPNIGNLALHRLFSDPQF